MADNFETVIGGENSKGSLPSIKDIQKQTNQSSFVSPIKGHDIKEQSKYGEDITPETDLNERRGEQQGALEKYTNGALRMAGTAGTSFLEGTVGLLAGTTEALFTGDATKMYNNGVGQGLDKVNEALSEAFPIYYTEEQRNSIMNSNFIPDKLFNGAGYMIGAIGAGSVGGGVITSALGKLGMAGKLAPALLEGENAAQNIINAAKATKLANGAQELAVGALSAHGESAQEARGVRKDTYEKLVGDYANKYGKNPEGEHLAEINKLADSAGNVDYLTNLVITGGTNMLQFGKVMTGGYKANEKAFWQIIRDKAGKYGTPELSKAAGVFRTASPFLEGATEEAFQEGAQYTTQKGTTDYYSRKFDKDSWDTIGETINSLKDAANETLTSREGFESMLLGGLLGAGGGVLHNENKATDANTSNAINVLNSETIDKTLSKLGSAATIQSYEKDKEASLLNKDKFNYNNASYDQFKTFVNNRVAVGQFNTLIDELDEVKTLTEQQFKEKYGYPENEPLPKSVPQLVEDLKKEAIKIKDVSESIDLKFPINNTGLTDSEFGFFKTQLFHTTTVLDNNNKRLAELSNKIGLPFSASQSSSDPNYVQNYIDIVDNLIKEKTLNNPADPALASLKNDAADIIRLDARRKQFIDAYNTLQTPEGIKAQFAQTVEGIKAQQEAQAAKTPVNPPVEDGVNQVEATQEAAKPVVKPVVETKVKETTPKEEIKVGSKFVVNKNGVQVKFKINPDGSVKLLTSLLDNDKGDIIPMNSPLHAEVDKIEKELKGKSLEEINKIVNGTTETKEPTKKVVKEEEPQVEGGSTNTQTIDELFGEAPTFKNATKKVLEQPPITEAGDEAELEPISQGGVSMLKTSATDTETRLKENDADRIRWNNYVDNFKGDVNDYLFKIVRHGDELYDKLSSKANKKYIADELEEGRVPDYGVFLLLTDKYGNPIKANDEGVEDTNGKLLWTSPVKNAKNEHGYAVAPDHYSKVYGLEYKAEDENNPQSEFRQHFDSNEVPKHEAWRNELLNGTHEYIRPAFKSPGALMFTDAKVDSNWKSPLGTLYSEVNNPANDGVEFIIPTTPDYDKEGNPLNYKTVEYTPQGTDVRIKKKLFLGALYAKKGDTYIKLKSTKVADSKTPTAVENTLLSIFERLNEKGKLGDVTAIKYYIQMSMTPKDFGKNTLYFDNGVIHYGLDGEVLPKDVRTDKNFRRFLKDRKRQVDTSLIKPEVASLSNPALKEGVPVINENGKIDYNNRMSYYEFLFAGDKPAFTINLPPITEKQHENSYFGFDTNSFVTEAITPKEEVIVEGEPTEVSTKEDIERRRQASIAAIKEQDTAGGFVGNYISETKDDSLMSESYESTKEEFIKEINEHFDKELKALEETKPTEEKPEEEGFDFDIPGEAEELWRLASNDKYVKEDIKKAEQWYKEKFGSTADFKVTKELIDNKAFGRFYKGITYLYEQAEEGTLYHEAYHKVEEEYLTPEQVANIHAEQEKTLGRKLTKLEGQELRAEDFRNYMLTGQKAIAGKPVRNTVFRRLYNYIRTLLTGKVTIEQVYRKLASKKGYSTSKKVRTSDASLYSLAKSKKLLGMDSAETREVMDGITQKLFGILYQKDVTPEVLVNEDLEATMIKAYTSIFNQTRAEAIALNERFKAGEKELLPALAKYKEILNSWNDVVTYHKKVIRPLIRIESKENDTTGEKLKESVEDTNEYYFDESTEETPSLEENAKDGRDYVPANEINPISTLSNNTKMILASLSEVDKAGNPVLNKLGQKVVAKDGYSKIYLTLSKNLQGALTIDNLWNKMTKLSESYPYVKELQNILGKPSLIPELSDNKFKVWTDFIKDMNKYNSQGTKIIYNKETGEIVQVDANSENLKKRIKDTWKNKAFKSPYMEEVNGVKQFNKKPEGLQPLLGLEVPEFLDAIGIQLEGIDFNSKDTSKEFTDLLNRISLDVSGIKESLRKTTESSIADIFKDFGDEHSAVSRLNDLLDIAAEKSTIVVEGSYYTANNKSKFSLTNHNYFSKIVCEINNASTFKDLVESCPWFGTVSLEGSITLKSLFDENGNKRKDSKGNSIELDVKTYAGFKEVSEIGNSTTGLHAADKMAEEFNNLLFEGLIAFPRTADKATEQGSHLTAYTLSNGNQSHLPVPIKEVTNDFSSIEIRNYFEGIFKGELSRIRAFNIDGLGKNIETYKDNAGNWTYFEGILSKETKEALESYLNSRDEVSEDLLNKINIDVQNYLNDLSETNANLLKKYGIGEKYGLGKGGKSKYLGVSIDLTSMPNVTMDVLNRAFTVNQLIKSIEDHKIFYGDKAFYKDPFKRYAAYSATKKYANADKVLLDRINKKQQFGEYAAQPTVRTMTTADVMSISKSMSEFKSALKDKYTEKQVEDKYSDYLNMTEADAQGLSSLIFYKHFKQLCSEWTPKEDKQYNYDMAYEVLRVSKKYPDTYGKKYTPEMIAKAQEYVDKGNPGYPLMPMKPQHAGAQEYKDKETGKPLLYAPTFHKYSIAPMFYRLVEGTNLEEKYLDMVANEVGYMVFSSGNKVGALLNEEGKMPTFYNEDGTPRLIDSTTPIQNIYYKNLGIQVDIAPKVKEKVTFPTQLRKLFMANSFNSGIPFDYTGTKDEWNNLTEEAKIAASRTYEIHKEFLGIMDSMIEDTWNSLVEELGFKEVGDEFVQLDLRKLVKLLREDSLDRQLADNTIDALEVAEDGTLKYPIDSMVNREKLESMLFSLVNSRVIKQTMPGDGMIQKAITGSETGIRKPSGNVNKKGEPLYLSNNLLFYREGEDGKTLPMQVKVPLTAQFNDLKKLVKGYKDMSPEQLLAEVNKLIKEDSFDKRLLFMAGCRIPVQGLNSIESMEIVEFIADTAGNTIILPTEIVAKSGGDFDIDKLNIFRANFSLKGDKSKVDYVNSKIREYNKSIKDDASKSKYPLTSESGLQTIVDTILPEEDKESNKYKYQELVKASIKGYDKYLEKHKDVTVHYATEGLEAKQNRITELMKEMLEHPKNYEQLTTPNTTSLLKNGVDGLVDKIRAAKGIKESKKSSTKELTFGHILDQFIYFLGGKAGVGIAAIHNTFHTLFQEANTKISRYTYDKYIDEESYSRTDRAFNFDLHGDEDNIFLGETLDKAGRTISDTISQFINAYVDVAKDPFYKDLNAGLDAAGVYFFLIHAGADIETVSFFMNQPAIIDLLNAEAANNSILASIKGKKKKSDIFEEIKKKYNKAPRLESSIILGEKWNEDLLKWMNPKNDSKEFYAAQLQFLEDFDRYRKYGNDLSELTRTLNSDTSRINSFAQGDKVKEDIARIESGQSIFSKESRDAIHDLTVVGRFDKLIPTQKMYKPLFITQKEAFTKTRERLIGLIKPFKAEDKVKLYKLIDNDFINYITQRFYKEGTEMLGKRTNELAKGENSMAMRLLNIKKILPDNILVNQLQSQINKVLSEPSNIALYSRKLDVSESNDITESFRELLEYQGAELKEVQKFAKDLVKFGIIQSGLANSPITYLGLIPFEEYGDIVNQATKNYEEAVASMGEDVVHNDFIARFFLKNNDNRLVVKEAKQGKEFKNVAESYKSNGKQTVRFIVKVGDEVEQVPYTSIDGMKNIVLSENSYKLQDFYLSQQSQYLEINFPNDVQGVDETGEDLPNNPIDSEGDVETTSINPIYNSIKVNQAETTIRNLMNKNLTLDEILSTNTFNITPEELQSIIDKITQEDNSGLDKNISDEDVQDLMNKCK